MNIRTHTEIAGQYSGRVITHSEGKCEVELITTDIMRADSSGLIHGGFIFSAADYTAMCLVNHPYVVLASAEVRFKKPTKVGEILTFIAEYISTSDSTGDKRNVVVSGRNQDKIIVFEGKFFCFIPENHILSQNIS